MEQMAVGNFRINQRNLARDKGGKTLVFRRKFLQAYEVDEVLLYLVFPILDCPANYP